MEIGFCVCDEKLIVTSKD